GGGWTRWGGRVGGGGGCLGVGGGGFCGPCGGLGGVGVVGNGVGGGWGCGVGGCGFVHADTTPGSDRGRAGVDVVDLLVPDRVGVGYFRRNGGAVSGLHGRSEERRVGKAGEDWRQSLRRIQKT